jgi:mannose-1-phosphate guanylyltransferase
MILAAGLGTRLRPLTDELPKPLVPVGDRPVVADVAEQLARAGFTRAVMNVCHRAEAFTPERLGGLPLAIDLVREDVVLGTGGAVANAARELGEGDVLLWNGDILAEVDVAALLEAHEEEAKAGAIATLALSPRGAGEGTIGLGARGEVVRLRGERFGDEVSGGDFFGVHVVGSAIRARLKAPGCIIDDGYLPLLREGGRVATFAVASSWDDVGTVTAYLDANARWLARRGLDHFVGAGARVDAGVDVRGSVIGAGAIVTGEGRVTSSVVWPGATARAPLDRIVVTNTAVVIA